MVPISKVALSVALQHNKELEKQQAAIQQVMGCLCGLMGCTVCLTVQAFAANVHSTVDCDQFTDPTLLRMLCL